MSTWNPSAPASPADIEQIQRLAALYHCLAPLINSYDAIWTMQVRTIHFDDGREERLETRRFNREIFCLLLDGLVHSAIAAGDIPDRPQPSSAPAAGAFNPDNPLFDCLTPEEKADFIRLHEKLHRIF